MVCLVLELYGATIVCCSFSLDQMSVTRRNEDTGSVVFIYLYFVFGCCFFLPAPHIVLSQSCLYFLCRTRLHVENQDVLYCFWFDYASISQSVQFSFLFSCHPLVVVAAGAVYFEHTYGPGVISLHSPPNGQNMAAFLFGRYMGNFQSLSFLLGNNIQKIYAYNATKSEHCRVHQVPRKW